MSKPTSSHFGDLTDAPAPSRLPRAARIMGALAVAVGGLAVVDWMLRARPLATEPVTATAPEVAIGWILCGLGLCAPADASRPAGRRARVALPALALALAAVALSRDLGRLHFHIDAVELVLIASALVARDAGGGAARWAQAPAIAAMVIAFMALVGHAFGVDGLIGIALHTQMTLAAAVGFLLLSVGFLLASPDDGVIARLTGDDAGGIVARRLVPVVVGLPLVIGWLRLQGERLGLYNLEFGVVLMVITTNLALLTVVLWTARALGRADHERVLAHRALRRANEDLERRVDERTGELLSAIAELRSEIDVRKRAEQLARTSEQRLRAVTETAHDGVISLTPDGSIQFVNPAAEAMFGRASNDLIGTPLASLIAERHRDALRDGLRAGPSADGSGGPGKTLELIGVRGDGRDLPIEVSLGRWTIGRDTLVTVIVRDITERKELQARVLLSDRMASVGTLAAGVAHEINNPLTYVIGNVELAERRLLGLQQRVVDRDPDSAAIRQQLGRVQELLGDVMEGGLRIRDIVTKLRTLTRADEEEQRLVDLRQVADSAINITWHEMKHRARLTRDYGEVRPVRGNTARLGQVLVNLLVNAAHAIQEGHADQNEIRIRIGMDGPDRIAVAVSDTGCGIAPDVIGRIFDPFFTTKAIGVGTGLGLSICHNIVSDAGGRIEVDTCVGKGTTFRVVLPTGEVATTAPAAEPPHPASRRRGRILVVDDEPKVAALFERALEAEHDVEVSTSGRDALARTAAGAPFDLILCDLMMPEMTGMELHAELERIAPALASRMIFITGGAFTTSAREFLERSHNPTLEKPFGNEELLALVGDLLR